MRALTIPILITRTDTKRITSSTLFWLFAEIRKTSRRRRKWNQPSGSARHALYSTEPDCAGERLQADGVLAREKYARARRAKSFGYQI
jgi:hypothetical protein